MEKPILEIMYFGQQDIITTSIEKDKVDLPLDEWEEDEIEKLLYE